MQCACRYTYNIENGKRNDQAGPTPEKGGAASNGFTAKDFVKKWITYLDLGSGPRQIEVTGLGPLASVIDGPSVLVFGGDGLIG